MTEDKGRMFVAYTVIAMVHTIYIMMLEYDSLQMLNAMLVAINTIRVATYIHTKCEYTVGVLFVGVGIYIHPVPTSV